MSRRYYSSTFSPTTTTASLATTDTTITVAALTGAPVSVPWTGVLERGTSNEELVTVTAVAGTTLTVTRGVGGQTPKTHQSGATFDHVSYGPDFDEPNAHINDATLDQHAQYGKRSQGLFANRPAAGRAGARFYATDSDKEYLDDGSAWHEILTATAGNAAYQAVNTALVRADVQRASVSNDESTASTTYVDLTSVGPAVTVTVPASGRVLLTIGSAFYHTAAGNFGLVGVALSGANTVAAADANALQVWASTTQTNGADTSATLLLTGLTPGSTTFTCKYRVGTATGHFFRRTLLGMPA